MDSQAQVEKEKYETVWGHQAYRSYSPGERHAEVAFKELSMVPGDTLIDWGCGTGRAVKWFEQQGISAWGVDLAENCLDEGIDIEFLHGCLWSPPDIEANWGYCTDVMEHIPPDKVDAVLDEIAGRSKMGAFFSIATSKDGFGPRILGEPLHLTVETAEWWADKLRTRFENITMKQRGTWATYVCGH